jgi:MoaA/NifB/PqqE/SkfB family radical SAM enzyme
MPGKWLLSKIGLAGFCTTDLPYLGIRYQVRYHQCNIRCPYCIVSWDQQENLFDAAAFKDIVSKMKALPYRVSLRIGVGGEIFTSLELMAGIQDICNTPSHIRNVSFSTNLVASWEKMIGPFFSSLDTSRIGIGCTLHDMVIRDIDEFFSKVQKIKKMGVEVYVGYVAIPGRFQHIAEYKKRCGDLGVPLIMNGLVGKLMGVANTDPSREYPGAYSREEISELKALWDTPHSYQLLIESCETKGMACSAGKNYIYLDHQGNVYPSAHIRKNMGNILADSIVFQRDDTICPNRSCWCGNENQALRIVDRYYDRSRTLRIFYPKKGVPRERLFRGYNPTIFFRD